MALVGGGSAPSALSSRVDGGVPLHLRAQLGRRSRSGLSLVRAGRCRLGSVRLDGCHRPADTTPAATLACGCSARGGQRAAQSADELASKAGPVVSASDWFRACGVPGGAPVQTRGARVPRSGARRQPNGLFFRAIRRSRRRLPRSQIRHVKSANHPGVINARNRIRAPRSSGSSG